MPDLIDVFARKWKLIVFLTLLATAVAVGITLLLPKKYLSVATALPASSILSDKARVFNKNIEGLYPSLGNPDDLDRILGTAELDTVYIAISRNHNLAGHYLVAEANHAVYKAAEQLKKNSVIQRSAYGELQIKVWDKSPELAADLANWILEYLQKMHQLLQNENNSQVLQKIKEDYARKQQEFRAATDSGGHLTGADAQLAESRKAVLLQQLEDYEKLEGEYQFALATNPQVLLTVEKARPSLRPDRPKVLPTALFVLFASFLSACLLALLLESRKLRK